VGPWAREEPLLFGHRLKRKWGDLHGFFGDTPFWIREGKKKNRVAKRGLGLKKRGKIGVKESYFFWGRWVKKTTCENVDQEEDQRVILGEDTHWVREKRVLSERKNGVVRKR